LSADRAGKSCAAASDARGVVGSGIVGNILEWYDFALYGYFAPVIAPLFFPSADPLTSMVSAFAVFAIGFLARPLGGVLYGRIGDRAGRRTMLIASVALMGAPTFLIGLLPTYATAGLLAPVLLVLLRLVQGVSAGGEFTGSIAFLVEHAPKARQGLYGSLANFGAVIGGLLGAGAGWLTTDFLSLEALQSWGWRIPFLSGLLVSLAGLWTRLRVADSPAFVALKVQDGLLRSPVRTALREHSAGIATVFGLNWAVSAGYYITFVWLVTGMTEFAHLSLHEAVGIGAAGLALAAVATPLAGHLSDRLGRRTLLVVVSLATAAGAVPLLLLALAGGALAALLAQLALALLVAGYLGTLPAVFAAQFPPRLRCSGLALGYNAAVGLFGGTAPLIATFLIGSTGWHAAPGLYLAGTALLALGLDFRVPARASGNGAD
jgi:MFS transporter, MHS family, proline/betaine transporter